MDGNGRWAAERGLPRAEGHRQGVESVRRTVKAALELGITHLTLFSFSSENWSRPRQEIYDLFGLMRRFVRRDLADLHKNGVRISVIGTRSGLDDDILRLIDDAVRPHQGQYRRSISPSPSTMAPATRSPAPPRASPRPWLKARSMLSDITPERFGSYLDTADLPDPDLLIRTSGELRLSNFLLWQLAYSEFVFVDTYWPDFSRETLEAAIAEYQRRTRRFGGLKARSTA